MYRTPLVIPPLVIRIFALLTSIVLCSCNQAENNEAKLLNAAVRGDFNTVQKLVNSGVNVNAKDKEGNTVLHLTVNPQVAKYVLEKGADINARNNDGNTPLHCAVTVERYVQFLLENGADIDIEDNNGATPIYHAIASNDRQSVKLIIQHGDGLPDKTTSQMKRIIKPLEYALIRANPKSKLEHKFDDQILYLLANAIDVHVQDDDGHTPITRAILKLEKYPMYRKVIPILLESGADINREESNGWTPLDYAYRYQKEGDTLVEIPQDPELVNYLKSKGAIRGKGAEGGPVIHLPTEDEIMEIAKKAVADGGDINRLLFDSIARNFPKVACYLIQHGADVNTCGEEGGATALFYASARNHVDVVRLMISKGVRVDAVNKGKEGKTTLELIMDWGILCPEIAQMLIDHGAKVKRMSRMSLKLD